MRKHPLLAFLTTTATLTTTAVVGLGWATSSASSPSPTYRAKSKTSTASVDSTRHRDSARNPEVALTAVSNVITGNATTAVAAIARLTHGDRVQDVNNARAASLKLARKHFPSELAWTLIHSSITTPYPIGASDLAGRGAAIISSATRRSVELLISSLHGSRLVHPAAAASSVAVAGGPWLALRTCESGNDYSENSGNGYYGAYQFLPSTWWAIGFTGLPSQASPQVQDEAAEVLEARVGWSAWPECASLLDL